MPLDPAEANFDIGEALAVSGGREGDEMHFLTQGKNAIAEQAQISVHIGAEIFDLSAQGSLFGRESLQCPVNELIRNFDHAVNIAGLLIITVALI